MRFKNFSYLLFFFATFGAIAQGTGTMISYELIPSREDVDGSPYVSDTFLPSKVMGVTEISALMRYNAEKDEMEFSQDGKRYHLYKSDSLEVRIAYIPYKYLTYETNKGINYGFLQVLIDREKGKEPHSLYKKQTITLVAARPPKSSYDQATKAHYRREDDRFFITVGERIVSMPKKKKELLNLLPAKTTEIEGYLKANKVDFEDEKNLIDLVKFLNTLK